MGDKKETRQKENAGAAKVQVQTADSTSEICESLVAKLIDKSDKPKSKMRLYKPTDQKDTSEESFTESSLTDDDEDSDWSSPPNSPASIRKPRAFEKSDHLYQKRQERRVIRKNENLALKKKEQMREKEPSDSETMTEDDESQEGIFDEITEEGEVFEENEEGKIVEGSKEGPDTRDGVYAENNGEERNRDVPIIVIDDSQEEKVMDIMNGESKKNADINNEEINNVSVIEIEDSEASEIGNNDKVGILAKDEDSEASYKYDASEEEINCDVLGIKNDKDDKKVARMSRMKRMIRKTTISRKGRPRLKMVKGKIILMSPPSK